MTEHMLGQDWKKYCPSDEKERVETGKAWL